MFYMKQQIVSKIARYLAYRSRLADEIARFADEIAKNRQAQFRAKIEFYKARIENYPPPPNQ